ncbi:MAG: tRNA (adenosine(37)-N6)-dimethylallyltransferase MiaA [Thermodesulfovibrionales bacterium]
MDNRLVLIILGPTCVGKTGASILLAKSLGTEIISADSMQIYRHMDIGTAKPTIEQREMVKHHMIDIVEPSESYSTGRYVEAVRPVIDKLHSEGKIPIIVGGTGLYIRAMTRGIFSGPSADWGLREKLLAVEEKNKGFLYACLEQLDPDAASKVMRTDIRRIIRALEVCLKSSTTISELRQRLTQPLMYEFIKIGITRDRKELYRLIEQRVDRMIENGLVEEVKAVLKLMRYSSTPSLHHSTFSSMQAIGYKEIAAHLMGEFSRDDAIRLIKKRTKNYAKRQFTWFKKEEGIRWLDITGLFTDEEIYRAIAILLENLLTYAVRRNK